jgi:hypothetical protein
VSALPAPQALKVLFQDDGGGLPRPRDLRGRCRHGRREGHRCGCLAAAPLRVRPPGVLGPRRLLSKIHPGVRSHCSPAYAALAARRLHLGRRRCGCFRGAQGRPDFGSGPSDAGLLQAVHGGLRCVRSRLWRGTPSDRLASTNLVQSPLETMDALPTLHSDLQRLGDEQQPMSMDGLPALHPDLQQIIDA